MPKRPKYTTSALALLPRQVANPSKCSIALYAMKGSLHRHLTKFSLPSARVLILELRRSIRIDLYIGKSRRPICTQDRHVQLLIPHVETTHACPSVPSLLLIII